MDYFVFIEVLFCILIVYLLGDRYFTVTKNRITLGWL